MRERALAMVGQGYVYGAKGQTCTPAFRQQQAAQYPEQAHNILQTAQKWDGKPVWDCAQLTRSVAAAGGVVLVSGANSQWTKTDWWRKGTFDTLPTGDVCFLYRQANGRMQHTGVSLGDGTCVHAKGSAFGVVREPVAAPRWTHWAIPTGGEMNETNTCRVWAANGNTVNLRLTPGGQVVKRVPIGDAVEVIRRAPDWTYIRHGDVQGYMGTNYLVDESLEARLLDVENRLSALEAKLL